LLCLSRKNAVYPYHLLVRDIIVFLRQFLLKIIDLMGFA
jgi:hypothetical protein